MVIIAYFIIQSYNIIRFLNPSEMNPNEIDTSIQILPRLGCDSTQIINPDIKKKYTFLVHMYKSDITDTVIMAKLDELCVYLQNASDLATISTCLSGGVIKRNISYNVPTLEAVETVEVVFVHGILPILIDYLQQHDIEKYNKAVAYVERVRPWVDIVADHEFADAMKTYKPMMS